MELRTLLERFANGQSMQPIFDAVNQLYTDAKEDPELKSWFRELGAFVRRALQEPGYIMKESCRQILLFLLPTFFFFFFLLIDRCSSCFHSRSRS